MSDKDEINLENGWVCPTPLPPDATILLAHGGGGRLMHQLIDQVFRPAFENPDQEKDCFGNFTDAAAHGLGGALGCRGRFDKLPNVNPPGDKIRSDFLYGRHMSLCSLKLVQVVNCREACSKYHK